jgi:hydrogenase expression/formation protein HypE
MILLGHGSGGRLSHQLVKEHFLPLFGNPVLSLLEDSAVIDDLAFTTDAYVVTPRFFPGGDLGRLAVSGTVNDLSMVGAEALALSAAFIIEEGFSFEELDAHIRSMSLTAKEANVPIVTGDTKVVPKGACDGLFITTSGIGRIDARFRPSPNKVQPGDVVIISGTIADHGISVMTAREGIRVEGDLRSDVAPLGSLVRTLRQANLAAHAMRDPTRGGVAQSLIEIATDSKSRIVINERDIPIKPPVRAACELLGLDPLYIANEGKLLLILPEQQADAALGALQSHPLGHAARVIGRVEKGQPGLELMTSLGGARRLRMHSGELLPRIC